MASEPINLTNQFLIAMPGMADEAFAGAVVYLCEHSEKGALGLMINKPVDIRLRNLFEKVDLTLDSSLRAGDVIATTSGLVAYSGIKLGANQAPEFTPVASYPGLTAEVRARLGEMKVAPVAAETIANDAPPPDASRGAALPATSVPKQASPKAKRAEVN